MPEKPDLKNFYESTQPLPDSILIFSQSASKRITSKETFVNLSNIGFAMLAHLKADSFENLEKHKSLKNYYLLTESCKNLKIITDQKTINPTAVPMIQRYMKIFEAYEKQNGLTNPYVKKEGKEPGDN